MDLKERKTEGEAKISRHPWEEVRKRIILSMLKRHFKQPEVILDLGCGDLYLATELANRYPNTTIFAVDTAFTASSIDSFFGGGNIPANLKISTTLDEVNAKVSVVLLLDVLEHIEKDSEFLQSLYTSGKVQAETLFLVTVPAFQALFSAHDKMLGHYRRYRLASLNKAAKTAKGQVVESGYFFGLPLLARSVGVLIERLTPNSERDPKGIGAWKGYGFADTLIKSALWLDYRLYRALNAVGFQLPGLSCYQVFRAPQL